MLKYSIAAYIDTEPVKGVSKVFKDGLIIGHCVPGDPLQSVAVKFLCSMCYRRSLDCCLIHVGCKDACCASCISLESRKCKAECIMFLPQ